METDDAGRRLFTIEEARALLPVIRPEVEHLLATFREIRDEIESTASRTGVDPQSLDLKEHLQSGGVVPRLFDRVRQILDRIHLHGCVVNGPEAGLIDFPCLYRNEIVFLCWKYGEPTIGHWHRIPDGFAGRRPLLDDSEEQNSGSAVH
jgi:hypothetical protein